MSIRSTPLSHDQAVAMKAQLESEDTRCTIVPCSGGYYVRAVHTVKRVGKDGKQIEVDQITMHGHEERRHSR